MYLNKALLIGNLTRDPELRSLPSGVKVTSFSIATNRSYTDSSGQRQEQTDFHNIVVFGRQAETVSQYLNKGSMVLIEGRIQTRSWEQDGEKKYRTEVVADRVQFGPKSAGGSGNNNSSNRDDSDSSSKEIDYPESSIDPDDIPF